MSAFAIYLLKSVLISGLLYAWYCLALRHRKLYNYSRTYLLAGMLLSLIIPALHYDLYQVVQTNNNTGVIKVLRAISTRDTEDGGIQAAATSLSAEEIFWTLYAIIAIGVLGTMAARMVWLYKIRGSNPTDRKHDITIVQTELDSAPFSFLNTLYWKTAIDMNSTTGKLILAHELVHIQQRHSLDKLLTGSILAFFWMNPFFWLMQKDLSMLHEFIADDGAVQNGDTESFAQMLLQSHFGIRFPDIVQPFFYSPIKNRLIMLQKSNKPRYATLRRLMVIPMLAGTVCLFSFSVKEKHAPIAAGKLVLVLDAGHGGDDEGGGSGTHGLREKDITLRVTRQLAKLAPEYNIQVLQTREGDNTVSLDKRVANGRGITNGIFVSIHVNKAVVGEKPHEDYEVLISPKNVKYAESRLLASAIIANLNTMNLKPALVENRGPIVLKTNTLPAILIECGNIDNGSQMSLLTDNTRLEQFCRNTLEAMVVYQKNISNKKQ